jgi:hypothetical protein
MGEFSDPSGLADCCSAGGSDWGDGLFGLKDGRVARLCSASGWMRGRCRFFLEAVALALRPLTFGICFDVRKALQDRSRVDGDRWWFVYQ